MVMSWDKSVALTWTGLIAFGLCGCSEPEKTALERLRDRGYAFQVGDFQRAAVSGDLETVELFVESGMAVDARDGSGGTALLAAVVAGQSGVARRLVEFAATHEVSDEDGRTPLIHAASSGDAALVDVLLVAGADAQACDRAGWTALTEAALEGHSDVAALLASLDGAEVDKALHLACVGGDVATVGVLLKAGASVYARSGEEKTALMYGAANGNLSVTKLLIRNGANRYALDAETQTAGQIARANGFPEVADLLEEPPADHAIDPDYSELAFVEESLEENEEAQPTGALGKVGFLLDLEEQLAEAERAAAAVASATDEEGGEAGGLEEAVPQAELSESLEAIYARATIAAGGDSSSRLAPGASGARVGGDRTRSSLANGSSEETAGGEGMRTSLRQTGGYGTGYGRLKERRSEHGSGRRDVRPRRVNGLSLDQSLVPDRQEERSLDSGVSRNAENPSIRMHGYRESQLPVMLVGIKMREGGERALVRLLYGSSEQPMEVASGDMIGETGLRVIEVQRRVAQTKQGGGKPMDVSRMIVEYPDSGERHLLVRGLPAMSNRVHAVVTLGEDQKTVYEARSDDRFTAGGGRESYRVLDVRPKQVVILREDSGQSFTVPKTIY